MPLPMILIIDAEIPRVFQKDIRLKSRIKKLRIFYLEAKLPEVLANIENNQVRNFINWESFKENSYEL